MLPLEYKLGYEAKMAHYPTISHTLILFQRVVSRLKLKMDADFESQ